LGVEKESKNLNHHHKINNGEAEKSLFYDACLPFSPYFFCLPCKRSNKKTSPSANSHSARPALRLQSGPRFPTLKAQVFFLRKKAGLPLHPPWPTVAYLGLKGNKIKK
jgi:hypothetical protein